MEFRKVQRLAAGLDVEQLQRLATWAERESERLRTERASASELGLVIDVVQRVFCDGIVYERERYRCRVPGCWCRGGRWHRGGWWGYWQDENGRHVQCFGTRKPRGI